MTMENDLGLGLLVAAIVMLILLVMSDNTDGD